MRQQKDYVKCKVRPKKLLYSKDGIYREPGSWAIVLCAVQEEYDGNVIPDNKGFIKVVGNMPELFMGMDYFLSAAREKVKKYGWQYTVERMDKVPSFKDELEQRAYLEGILTEKQINDLYENLPNPFETIRDRDVMTLCSVPGIGEKKAESIINKYYGYIFDSRIYTKLGKYGFTDNMTKKLLEKYGSADTIEYIIQENPYQLIKDVSGVGWYKADNIAEEIGIANDDVERIKAYIVYLLEKENDAGNSWTNVDYIAEHCANELHLTAPDNLRKAIWSLGDEGTLWWDEGKTKFALTEVVELERNIAKELYRLQTASKEKFADSFNDFEQGIKRAEEKLGFEYIDEQKEAIKKLLYNNVCILTASAGCGKTVSVTALLEILRNHSYVQTALSGRAASRMSEVTGEEGFTIHRALGFSENGGFTFNKDNPLEQDIIIVDEISMVGAELFYDLIQSIQTGSKLIMIGDDAQLESIGFCNVFKDMLTSGFIPVARLSKIHRQAARSAIITESAKVRQSIQLIPPNWIGTETRGQLQDLTLDVYDDAVNSQEHIINQFEALFKQTKNAIDIQIVLPQKRRGDICTQRINNIIQDMVNPARRNKPFKEVVSPEGDEYVLRLGDKVIVNKNNYHTQTPEGKECPIFNGNKGVICEIKRKFIVINFEQWGKILIKTEVLNTIELAYALTCHKLQGSESPYVIVGLDFTGRTLLTKEWLYTAITRAKKKCVLCAETRALSYAVKTSFVPKKRTFLKQFICEQFVNNANNT